LLFPLLSAAAGDQLLLDSILGLADEDRANRVAAIETLVQSGDARLETFFETYRTGGVYLWRGQPVRGGATRMDEDFNEWMELQDVLTGEPLRTTEGAALEVPLEEVVAVETGRPERNLARAAKFRLGLASPDSGLRLASVKRLGDPPRGADSVIDLDRIAEQDKVAKIRYTAAESAALIRVTDSALSAEERAAAARTLGVLRSARAQVVLGELLAGDAVEAAERPTYEEAVRRIDRYQGWVQLFDHVKRGLSTGSILVLMALGLAITFGMMGVINMAHGEMMMIGAYTTFCVQLVFGHSSSQANNWFFVVALPASFLVSAGVGGFIEYTIVRHLYKRPLESLLATFGVSLVLIQVVRLIFGDNQASNSPTWLVGSYEVALDMGIPYARLFIFALTVASVAGIAGLLAKTRLGLHMRATMQNRAMARSMGINTRAIDLVTFMLGSGIAGVAGCALTTIGGITPDMGQNYIIDSFLVVVAGGVGKLIGVIYAGFGLGVTGQVLEGNFLSPVWAKITLLIGLVAFIQIRPSGLFPPDGRLADDA
jgi:urea transport system permease protein